MKRFSLVPISLILAAVSASAAPNRSTARWPRFRALSRMCAMSTWLVMMGDHSIPTCFPKIATRSATCRTPFRSGQATIVYRGSCAATTATVTHLRPNARFWESDAQSASFAFGIGDHDRSPTPRRVFFLL
jgi:hypothetical protein